MHNGGCVKKAIFVCVTAALMLMTVSTLALADNGGLYLTAKGGVGFMRGDKSLSHNQTTINSDETKWKDSVFSYGGAVGWNWLDAGVPLRTEVEYYDHGDIKMTHSDDNATFSVTTDIQTLQFNVYYDLYNSTSFIPYLGAGVGVANLKSKGGKSTSNVSYSLFAGTAYKITETMLLDFTYRINQFGTQKFDWSDTNNSYEGKIKNLYAIEGTLGLRIQF